MSLIKGRGHNYWWLRRGESGRFRGLRQQRWQDILDKQLQCNGYAAELTLDLMSQMKTTPERAAVLKSWTREHLDEKPLELFLALRDYCVELGWVTMCPECGGEHLVLREDDRCAVCGGCGYVKVL